MSSAVCNLNPITYKLNIDIKMGEVLPREYHAKLLMVLLEKLVITLRISMFIDNLYRHHIFSQCKNQISFIKDIEKELWCVIIVS